MPTVVNFLGGDYAHRDGLHQTSARCPGKDRGNVGVEVEAGQVTGVRCLACGRTDFAVLVEGNNEFWPIASDKIIASEE